MPTRTRSSQRLAAKGASSDRPGSSDSGLILSDNGSHNSTPTSTPVQGTPSTSTASRRRGRKTKETITAQACNNALLTPLMVADLNHLVNSSPFDTPKSSGRKRRQRNVLTPEVVGSETSAHQDITETPTRPNELSLINDSFLFAVDALEETAQKENEKLLVKEVSASASVKVNESVNWGSGSPDIFEDGDLLDLMPASQMQIDPQKTPHRPLLNSSRTSSKKRKKSFGPIPTVLLAGPKTENQFKQTEGGSGPRKKKKGNGNKNDTKSKKKTTFKMAFTNRKIARLLSNNSELSKDELSCLSEEEKLKLTSWGLPASVIAKYKGKGMTSLFPWQLECLGNEKVLEGHNLLYSAPTSAGKTLVAEILMVKRVLELGKKALMILPFVSVCREKMFSLQDIFGDAGVRVEGFMGSYCPPGGFKAVDIAICTIEKANSLVNRLLEEGSLSQLGTIVVDELHLIGDAHRGYLLELLLTKIKYMTSQNRRNDSVVSEHSEVQESKRLNIQIIGMSATLPNLDLLSNWLDAELVVTDYRPVPLVERIVINGKIFDPFLNPIRDVRIESLPVHITKDEDHIAYLSLETILAGHSILIFCPYKQTCERVAQLIASEIRNLGGLCNDTSPEVRDKLRGQLNATQIGEVLAQLTQCPGGLEEVLKKTIAFGVAYHHAGLTYDERDIIESSFKRGVVRVIVATSTLSAGVNLPARRVIISTPNFNGGTLDVLTYRQMCGRAGRKGVDTEGKSECEAEGKFGPKSGDVFVSQACCESILICPLSTHEKGIKLVQSSLPFVKSALLGDEGALTSSMKRALLEVIASGIATLPDEVESYAKCTLLSKSIETGLYENDELPCSQQNKDETIKMCLRFLQDNDFVRLQKFENENKQDQFMATQLGLACLASSLAPDEGITVYKELQKARKRFVLDSDLHVVYQVTPIYLSDQMRNIDYNLYMNVWNDLSPEDKEVAELVGVEETFILRAMIGSVSIRNTKIKDKFMIHQRFWAALALNDLVNEMPISEVGYKYSLNKGVIQNLQQAASTFAGMVTAFCGRLGWYNMELLLSQFQERVQFGVQRELCDLVRLSTMNGQRARILYDNGIKTIAELAASDPAHVESILHRAAPFQSTVHGQSQSHRSIWVLGNKEGLSENEAAHKIVDEARQFIQMELGLPEDVQFAPVRTYESTKSQGQHQSQTGSKENLLEESESSSNDDETKEHTTTPTKLEDLQEHKKEDAVGNLTEPTSTKKSDADGIFTEEQQPIIEQESPTGISSKLIVKRNVQHAVPKTNDEAIFDDSFPPICSEDIFAEIRGNDNLPKQIPDEINAQVSFAKDQQVENRNETMDMEVSADISALLIEMMETSMDISENENENTPRSNRISNIGNESIKHSTPVLDANVINFKQRISVIPHPDMSEIQPESTLQNNPKTTRTNHDLNRNGSCELNEELLAEFDKNFESVTSLMEVSLNISGTDNHDNNVDQNACKEYKSAMGIQNVESRNKDYLKLSESDAAAMQAIADDSKAFESEDLFADAERHVGFSSANAIINPDAVLSNEGTTNSLSHSNNEQTHALELSMDGSVGDIFENSSEFESSKSITSGQSSARNCCHHESILSVNLGKDVLKVRKVLAPEFIPEDMFDPLKPVAIGLKLTPSRRPSSIARSGIGSRIIGPKCTSKEVKTYCREEEREHSIALYNGGNIIWVFQWKHVEDQQISRNRNGRIHPFLNIQGKLGELLGRLMDSKCSLILFDSKEKIKKLLRYFGKELILKLPISSKIWDPKIAQWMWQFNEDSWNVSVDKLADIHLKPINKKITSLRWSKEIVDSYVAWFIMKSLRKKLEECKLWDNFVGTEMPAVMPLMLMEMNGFGLDSQELNRMKMVLQFKAAVLEIRAFQLAGRQFSLSSPKDIRQILFREIGLKQPPKCKGTGKDVLAKLDHELPQVIIEWRKITSALQKVVIPFQQEKNLETGRIHGYYSHFTVTGRVVMSEPSLQCIPRDFDLLIDFSPEDIEDIKYNCQIKFGSKLSSLINQIEKEVTISQQNQLAGLNLICMRNVFIPCSDDFILLSADYSQLELRILAHLSQDLGLLKALNQKDGDVFVSIASQWKKLPPEQITSGMRQETKGIVYGVIYGMGAKTLSEQMEVDEVDASRFITEFMRTYPNVRIFLEKAKTTCRQNGFIETLSGRRRYLPQINSKNPAERAQAERQAVNSQIQGSAADLVKTAMTKIHARIDELFPESNVPINWNSSTNNSSSTNSKATLSRHVCQKMLSKVIVFPVLNLHDELIFEVRKSYVNQIAYEVRDKMESSLKLSVKLPVVVKTGISWGALSVFEK